MVPLGFEDVSQIIESLNVFSSFNHFGFFGGFRLSQLFVVVFLFYLVLDSY